MKAPIIITAIVSALLLTACHGRDSRRQETPPPVRHFPQLKIPLMYTDPVQAQQYTLDHYWDAFFAQPGRSDSLTVLGVPRLEVEQALANYIQILLLHKQKASPDNLQPLEQCARSVRLFFDRLTARQLADTTAHTYLLMTEMAARYFYDPNSPLRDEDLYLPFVSAVAESPLTRANLRAAYRHEAAMCTLNRFGEQAADFRFQMPGGRRSSLYGTKAPYTLLFFSNPGCQSCKEIVGQLRRPGLDARISSGELAVINIYIDEELDNWRAYVSTYPDNWLNGYDYRFTIRDGGDYDIRGIPSLYLLDERKRVLLKDAPPERVLAWLDRL